MLSPKEQFSVGGSPISNYQTLPNLTTSLPLDSSVPWTPLSLQNNWQPSDATPAYRRLPGGIVEIKGSLKKVSGTPTLLEKIAVLPPSCAPTEEKFISSLSQVNHADATASVFLQPTGELQYSSGGNFLAMPTVTYKTDKIFGLFFGDSNTAGYGVATDQRWSHLVAQRMGLSEDNEGVSGTLLQNTNAASQPYSHNGYDSYQSRIVQRYPDDVFIMYGLNDMRWSGGSTVSVFQTQLSQIVQNLIKDSIPHEHIYLGDIPYINPSKYVDAAPWNAGSAAKHASYNNAILGIAKQYHTHFADVYHYMLDHGANSLLQADGFHMKANGHSAISTTFLNSTIC